MQDHEDIGFCLQKQSSLSFFESHSLCHVAQYFICKLGPVWRHSARFTHWPPLKNKFKDNLYLQKFPNLRTHSRYLLVQKSRETGSLHLYPESGFSFPKSFSFWILLNLGSRNENPGSELQRIGGWPISWLSTHGSLRITPQYPLIVFRWIPIRRKRYETLFRCCVKFYVKSRFNFKVQRGTKRGLLFLIPSWDDSPIKTRSTPVM